MTKMLYQIKNIKIDTLKFHLTVDEEIVTIEPQVFDILIYLLVHRNRLVTRRELFDNIWADKVVSEASLSTYIKKIRQVLGDNGKQQQFIKTVPRRGFQFVAEVVELNLLHDELTQLFIESDPSKSTIGVYAQTAKKPLQLPDMPSVAVMDFVDHSCSEKGALFAYGLTNDVNAALSRLSNLFITSRASTTILSSLKLSSKEVAKRLGVHYLVYANTQYFSKRIKVTLTVVDAVNDTEIWSEHLDRLHDDILEVQKEITSIIVIAMDFAIEQAEITRSFLIPTENLSAWENYHRGLWYLNKTTKDDVQSAQFFFNKAVSIDARFSRAYAGLSYTHMSSLLLSNLSENSDDNIKKAYDFSWKSIDFCKFESMGYMTLGRVSFFTHEPEKALQALDQGIRLNPNYTYCHIIKGMASAHAGSTIQAEKHIEIAERLSPFDSLLFAIKMSHATSLVRQKKYTEAASISLLAAHYPNAFFTTYAIAAACHQLAGNNIKAQSFAQKTLQFNPGYSIQHYLRFLPFSEESTKQLMVKAMLESGIPAVSHYEN